MELDVDGKYRWTDRCRRYNSCTGLLHLKCVDYLAESIHITLDIIGKCTRKYVKNQKDEIYFSCQHIYQYSFQLQILIICFLSQVNVNFAWTLIVSWITFVQKNTKGHTFFLKVARINFSFLNNWNRKIYISITCM